MAEEAAAEATEAAADTSTEATETTATEAGDAAGSEAAPKPNGKAKGDSETIDVAPWRKELPADLRKSTDKFASETELAKAYNELEKRNSRSIVRPGKDATDEERDAYVATLRREMGIPESASDYKVDLPEEYVADENAQEWVQSFLELMHKHGAPTQAAAAAINMYHEMGELAAKAVTEQAARNLAEGEVKLRREWGNDFDPNKAIATAAFAKFADDDLVQMQALTGKELGEALGDKRLGDHPAWLRLFATVGRATGESRTLYQQTNEGQNLREEINKLRASDAFRRNDPATVARVQDMYKELYGEEAA